MNHHSVFAIATSKHHLCLASLADSEMNYEKKNLSDKCGVKQVFSERIKMPWVQVIILNFGTSSAYGLRGRSGFWKSRFLWELHKVPAGLRTASTSWCPAALKFPLAQKMYCLTSDLQLSTALLSHSCRGLTVNGKSYLVQTASRYCESRGLM